MSFNIATSGLNAITEQLNAISNNIANSGTVGFKSTCGIFLTVCGKPAAGRRGFWCDPEYYPRRKHFYHRKCARSGDQR